MNTIKPESIKQLKEFDNHRRVYYLDNQARGLKGFIAIHRKNKNSPSFGATRLWQYQDPSDALSDALRLSRMMSYKSALADLPCGGAKGVIIAPQHLTGEKRRTLLLAYTEEVNKLGGEFITGADVGISDEDLKLLKSASKFFVGTNTNPTEYTAIGVHTAIKTCLEFIYGNNNLSTITIALQGLGKIGQALLRLIYKEVKQIFAADVNPAVVKNLQKIYPCISIVAPSEIYKQNVDVFSPCALSHSLTVKSVDELKCRIVAGGANNQLENDSIGDKLFARGILYAPDYVINAGGLISVYDEYEHGGISDVARVLKKISAINDTLRHILSESKKRKIATNRIANEIAEAKFNSF